MFLATDSEEVLLAERLFSSSLVAVVSKSAPRKLRVCHFKKGTEICNYSYASKILSVKMNRSVRFQHKTLLRKVYLKMAFPSSAWWSAWRSPCSCTTSAT